MSADVQKYHQTSIRQLNNFYSFLMSGWFIEIEIQNSPKSHHIRVMRDAGKRCMLSLSVCASHTQFPASLSLYLCWKQSKFGLFVSDNALWRNPEKRLTRITSWFFSCMCYFILLKQSIILYPDCNYKRMQQDLHSFFSEKSTALIFRDYYMLFFWSISTLCSFLSPNMLGVHTFPAA